MMFVQTRSIQRKIERKNSSLPDSCFPQEKAKSFLGFPMSNAWKIRIHRSVLKSIKVGLDSGEAFTPQQALCTDCIQPKNAPGTELRENFTFEQRLRLHP